MNLRLLILFAFTTFLLQAEKTVTLSNLRPRTDSNGQIVDAHNGQIVAFGPTYYWYGTAFGTATGFQKGNSFQSYSSADMSVWKKEGALLSNAPEGVYIRPQVLYNAKTKHYVLWYRWRSESGTDQLGVAVSTAAAGPFKILDKNAKLLHSSHGIADFSLFADEDGTAYVFYVTADSCRGSVEKLRGDYLASTNVNSGFQTENCTTGALFKYKEKYYLVTDEAPASTPQGSWGRVYRSDKALGGYVLRNSFNRFPGTPAPMLVDGVLSPNLHVTLRKHSDGTFAPIQIDFQGDSTLNTIKVIQYTGSHPSSRTDGLGRPIPDPNQAPSFEVQYWKNGFWIPLRISEKAMSSSIYTLLDLRFETVTTRRLRILTQKSFPYDLKINEIEVSDKSQVQSGGAQAFLIDSDLERTMPVVPGRQTSIMPLQTAVGLQFIWMADIWGSATDNIQGHDYQYWSAPLEFDPKGDIEPIKWVDNWRVTLP